MTDFLQALAIVTGIYTIFGEVLTGGTAFLDGPVLKKLRTWGGWFEGKTLNHFGKLLDCSLCAGFWPALASAGFGAWLTETEAYTWLAAMLGSLGLNILTNRKGDIEDFFDEPLVESNET